MTRHDKDNLINCMFIKFHEKILKIDRVIVQTVFKKCASRKTRLKFYTTNTFAFTNLTTTSSIFEIFRYNFYRTHCTLWVSQHISHNRIDVYISIRILLDYEVGAKLIDSGG